MTCLTLGLIIGIFAHDWSWDWQILTLGVALAIDLYFLHLKYGDDHAGS